MSGSNTWVVSEKASLFLITSFTALKFSVHSKYYEVPNLKKIDTCPIDCIDVSRNIVKESDCFPKRRENERLYNGHRMSPVR